MRAINILNDPGEFYELCVKQEWTDEPEEYFDELAMFEGDPDMIRVNGKTGYFFELDNTIWYWFEEYGESIDKILIAFYEKRLNKEYWEDMQSWQYFDTHNAIAYRGGQGYVYTIYPLRIAS